ncbi:MAG TPA: bifunctional acetate--CoA ligase family protein/GNAT family N-acetyltransferase [Methylibium sp.]|nr:bifunctional acetate--CoA ligase family protein/GNAT family N-acetyltransferase [Methylibium sp.]
MTIRYLDRLLEPASVALIGATPRPGSVGNTVWRNLRGGGFAGPVMAVNPAHDTLDGEPVFARVADLPQAPDLAVICTPPASVPGLIAELGARGTRAAVVLSAGLTPAHKQAALDAARPHCLRLLGPNCIGLMTPRLGLNASFAHTAARPGDIAFVSQSGALVTAMLDWAGARGVGFSHLVSIGERIDVDFGDLLDLLASDAHTRAILLYIESIEAPRKFMSAARAAARNKPVIVVKAGRSAQGAQAAASHTGALAGADIVFDAAIRRAGMLRVETLQELFLAAQTLARLRPTPIEALTVLTNGGGGGVLAADAAERQGVPLYQPDAAMRGRLDALLPPTWSHGNPIDIIGDAPVERYTAALAALLAEPATGTVLVLHAPTAIVRSDAIAQALLPLASGAADRVMGCWLGETAVARARGLFIEAGIADYATPEEAVHALALLHTWRRNQEALLETPARSTLPAPQLDAARAIVAAALADGRGWLTDADAMALLAACGVPVIATRFAAPTEDAAAAAAAQTGYPVALKIASRDLPHKSDVGGVLLGLRDETELRAAVAALLARVRERRPEARLDGLTVQRMASRVRAHELIVGASVDPLFGPVLLFGAGGTAVEVLADRAVALPPLNRALAADLVSRTRIARLLAGYRDRPAARLDAVYDTLSAVARLVAELPEVAELDINPLLADDQGVLAVDARVRVSAERPGGGARFAIRPYPGELVDTLDWRGQRLLVRPIRPEDEPAHRRFIERLSPDDIRMRIFHTRRELPHSELARLTQIDYAREMALVAIEVDAAGREADTLGVVRLVADPDNVDAEFAIIVRSDLKGRGLGRLLMARIIDYARHHGTRGLVGDVLRANRAMLELAAHCGFEVDAADSDDEIVRLRLPL